MSPEEFWRCDCGAKSVIGKVVLENEMSIGIQLECRSCKAGTFRKWICSESSSVSTTDSQ